MSGNGARVGGIEDQNERQGGISKSGRGKKREASRDRDKITTWKKGIEWRRPRVRLELEQRPHMTRKRNRKWEEKCTHGKRRRIGTGVGTGAIAPLG